MKVDRWAWLSCQADICILSLEFVLEFSFLAKRIGERDFRIWDSNLVEFEEGSKRADCYKSMGKEAGILDG